MKQHAQSINGPVASSPRRGEQFGKALLPAFLGADIKFLALVDIEKESWWMGLSKLGVAPLGGIQTGSR